ncbi:hypothetical protein HCUR_01072 [Holospora curviuscula]|uniref:Uncharacterized protein n=1 Tax=Holospora curviuscula TaxID=1082868 RepID=A0A2S5R887_9PROT|nr:hypothetical protein HCUR_01072 [Holospora curviuscula]
MPYAIDPTTHNPQHHSCCITFNEKQNKIVEIFMTHAQPNPLKKVKFNAKDADCILLKGEEMKVYKCFIRKEK